MTWRDRIADLDYYQPRPVGFPCYCSILTTPGDLYLQGQFPAGNGSYTLFIETLSPDGLTTYQTVTSYFQYFFASNPVTGDHFFNARLSYYASSMCTYLCWILHARVTDSNGNVVFDKYTERYCQSSCCSAANDVGGAQEGISEDNANTIQGSSTVTVSPTVYSKVSDCGEPIITLKAIFDCYDLDGNYYGTPTDTFSGTAFGYNKIVNMRGRVVKRPRTIDITRSYNCRLQMVESKRVYLLEGYEYFPEWQSDEIETMLSANHIYIDDVEFKFDGGTPFSMASNCYNIFRLQTELSGCTQRQVFGCDTACSTATNFDGSMIMYIIPSSYDDGYFYDEDRQLIAQSYDELLDYFRNLDGVYELTEISTSPLSCETYGAFGIRGYGYIPNGFYFDMPINTNRVYGTVLNSIDDICPTYGQTCETPVTDYYYVEDQICATPVTDFYYVEEQSMLTFEIDGYGNWYDTGDSAGLVSSGQASLYIKVRNNTYVEDPDSPAAPVLIPGQIVATIGTAGRPDIQLVFTSNNSNLTGDSYVLITPEGLVYYSGDSTDETDIYVEVEFTVYYNLENAV